MLSSILKTCFITFIFYPNLISDQKIEITNVGFETPESVEYYAEEDVYLVTNINGSPLEKDGNGFVSKIKPDGSILNLKWLDGQTEGVTLNAPKGVEIVKNRLYITDLQHIRVFELPSGKQLKSIEIPQSTFLNGITQSLDQSTVYVTDSGLKEGFAPSGSDAIYKINPKGEVTPVYSDPDMGRPNGIISDNHELWVVSFGSGNLFKIDQQGKKLNLPKPGKEGLDGLIKLEDGRLLISSWGESGIYSRDHKGQYSILFPNLDAPADMGLDTKRNRLLVPLFKENKVVILPLN